MRLIIGDMTDVPAPVPLVDRRRNPDRRSVWRGGRRNSDWVNRPPHAWRALERQNKTGLLKRAVSVLHLW